MAHGDPQLSPWVSEWRDNSGLIIRMTVNYNDASRAINSAVIHRDSGCEFNRIAFDNPNDTVRRKILQAPGDGQPDVTYMSAQIAAQGLTTIDQAMALQITALKPTNV